MIAPAEPSRPGVHIAVDDESEIVLDRASEVESLLVSSDIPDESRKDLAGAVSPERFLKFLSSVPGVSKEVVLKIFPDLAKLLGRGTEAFEKMHKSTIDANTSSQELTLKHEQFVAQVYAEQLRLETLTHAERADLNEKIEAGAKRVFAKDSENKEFLLSLLKLAGAGVLGALALAVVVVGTKSAIEDARI